MSQHPLPEQIGKYRIERLLGQGAMGVVYRALDTQIERTVAIKVLHDHLRQGELGKDLEQRFLQEAKAAARCLHPNIVTIFDFGSEARQHFIAMEYVEGVELKAHLDNHLALSLASATDITIQILEALAHAHDKGVVHRDIKPANIILLENGQVKVSDFGVARIDTSDLTSTGFMIGTPNYMSPEGLQGATVDQRSDLYSVGVLYYELLTRMRPLRGMSVAEALEPLNTVASLSVQNLHSIRPILEQALQPHAEKRFQTARDFIARLQQIDDMDLTAAKTVCFPSAAVSPVSGRPHQVSSTAPTSPSQISDHALTAMEQSLTGFIGPLARVLVRKNSQRARSLDELTQSLAKHIPNEREREQFLRLLDRQGVTQSGLSQSAPASAGESASIVSRPGAQNAVSPEQLVVIAEQLAFFIGPLAGRLTKTAAKKYTDPEQLLAYLSGQIPDTTERQTFLSKVASRL